MILSIHPENPDPRKIQQVIDILLKGGVIIYPTDAVYSIGCLINQPKAIERVARLKKARSTSTHLSIVCKDLSHLSSYCRPMENSVFKLMKRALPGPYTFILNANNEVPKIFKSKKKTVGIRVPDNDIPRKIVELTGIPLVATSVHGNDEIQEYTTDPELIHENYEKQVDLVIDGGIGKLTASTIFDCTGAEPEVIREGLGPIDGLI